MGADGVEIDVHNLRGELIVIHDSNLGRTTDGSGPLRRKTLAQIRSLNAGKGEKVPLLSEVLDIVSGRALVNIELKGARTAIPALALLHKYIAAGWPPERFLVSSFRWKELAQIRGAGLRLGPLFARSARRFRPVAQRLGAWSVHVPLAHVNARLVSRIHGDGRKILVYTANLRADMDRLEAMGVDGFFTDYPDRWTQ